GGLSGLRRAGGALLNERHLCHPGRCGQVSRRATAGCHPGGRPRGIQRQKAEKAVREEGYEMKELELHKIPNLPFDVSEALNQLRINLGFCGDQIKTIMVTSSVPNEGKSFVTLQLWKMIAEVWVPAVLIDCDLRNSEMRRKYEVRILRNEKLVGVPHYLAGQAAIEDVIYKTNIPNGYMIPVTSAIANPTILLESPNFTRMLEYCAERFTYVLVDTPP